MVCVKNKCYVCNGTKKCSELPLVMSYLFSYLNKGLIANNLLPRGKLNLDLEHIFVVSYAQCCRYQFFLALHLKLGVFFFSFWVGGGVGGGGE